MLMTINQNCDDDDDDDDDDENGDDVIMVAMMCREDEWLRAGATMPSCRLKDSTAVSGTAALPSHLANCHVLAIL